MHNSSIPELPGLSRLGWIVGALSGKKNEKPGEIQVHHERTVHNAAA
jgi:hypothetical protein